MTVNVKRLGGSMAVVIPKSLATEIGVTEGTPLDVTTSGDAIVMRKSGRRPRRRLAEIVAQISTASYRRRNRGAGGEGELGQDSVIGREVW